MDSSVYTLMEEMKNRMLGYVVLLQYRYSNLCVKADPMALMSIMTDIGGSEVKIEEIADVALQDEFTFRVIPKYNEVLGSLIEGTKKVHPEFRVEVRRMEESEDEEDREAYFRMPDVDDDRKGELEDAVRLLGDDCRKRLDACRDLFRVRIGAAMAGEDRKAVDERNREIDSAYDWNVGKYGEIVEAKKAEIAEAWNAWKQRQAESGAGESGGPGADAAFRMKLGE